MEHFNTVVEDHPAVGYYSFGSKKKEAHMSPVLKRGYEIITDHSIEIECDGMMSTRDVKWGNYLMTFEMDHFEVIGMKPEIKAQCPNLITDNLRVDEIRQANFKRENPGMADAELGRSELYFNERVAVA
jgi:hypothetical protein